MIFSIDCLFCLCLLKSNRVYFIILHDLFACFRGTATKCNDSKMLSGIVDLEGNGTKANVRNSTQGIPPKGLSAIACLVACAVTAVDFTLPFFNNKASLWSTKRPCLFICHSAALCWFIGLSYIPVIRGTGQHVKQQY